MQMMLPYIQYTCLKVYDGCKGCFNDHAQNGPQLTKKQAIELKIIKRFPNITHRK